MKRNSTQNNYAVIDGHPWNRDLFQRYVESLPGNWVFLNSNKSVSLDRMDQLGLWYILIYIGRNEFSKRFFEITHVSAIT